MTRYLLVLFLFISFGFVGCEDKKTSRDNIKENEGIETSTSAKNASEEKNTTTGQKKEATRMIDTVRGQLLEQKQLIPFLTQYGKENPENKVRISTKYGDIDVLLYNDTPLHRANFILLVKENYFEETFFHRVVEGFVIQGGNSDNPSTNRKRYKIGSYLIPNEYTPNHPHTHGAFSAAKYSEQNVSNASSPFEFFIVQSKKGAHHLDGDHTVFGTVTRGMEVVDKIAAQETDDGEWPMENIEMSVEIID